MIRPNGSVIGADNEGGGRSSSFMQQALCTGYSRDRSGVVPLSQCRHDAVGLQCAIAQRVEEAGGGDAAPGCGNGVSADSLAAFGGFGFLGLCTTVRPVLGGGPAGWSSANTGL